MIKVIAFDLVGVLLAENDFELDEVESKIEKLFGPNKSDEEFLKQIKNFYKKSDLISKVKNIINNIYDVRDINILKILNEKYPNIKLIITTNHVSFIKDFLTEKINTNYLDKIFISSEMNLIKPNKDFYKFITKEMKVLPNEILFLDDSKINIETASEYGMSTILVNKEKKLLNEIEKIIKEKS